MGRRKLSHLTSKAVIRRSLNLLLFAVIALSSAVIAPGLPTSADKFLSATSGQEATLLEPGKVIERELTKGQKHNYKLMLAKGQYARVVVEQHGIDVIIRASGPDGKLIAEADSQLGNQGRETAELVAESDAPYLLSVEVA